MIESRTAEGTAAPRDCQTILIFNQRFKSAAVSDAMISGAGVLGKPAAYLPRSARRSRRACRIKAAQTKVIV